MKRQNERTWKKNDELTLEITDMGSRGEGIGHTDGYALFVKDALAGDIIRARITKVKKNFAYARLMEIIQPSPDRIEPVCPVAKQCGGCQLQHCSYERQLAWKEQKIANCLRRIGGQNVMTAEEARNLQNKGGRQEENFILGGNGRQGENAGQELKDIRMGEQSEFAGDEGTGDAVVMERILAMQEPYHYRNKAQFPVGYDRDGHLVTGFYAERTHDVIPHMDCMIQDSCSREILELVMAFLDKYQIPAYQEKNHTGLVRHILIRTARATGQIMLCLVINGEKLPHAEELVQELLGSSLKFSSICLNINKERSNRILGEKIILLYGQEYIEDRIGDMRYRISPLSFYQVNPEQTKRLYDTVIEYAELQGNDTVWDLYCGIGTISLYLSRKADMVYGVEIIPQAIENANTNARLNHISNVEFYEGAAEDVVPQKYWESGGGLRADVVVLDPPRKGCDERLLETVVQMQPERIVYVSCDPATLARDVKYLCGEGYVLKRVRGCDMFGMSYHVETIVGLHRRDT